MANQVTQMLVSEVNAAPLWEQVAAGIRQSIQAGRLRPGDRVVEAQLARQLGISRNPIREALRQLQQQGILEYTPNVGTLVAHVSAEDAQFAIEMRAMLEARAARLILESGNEECVTQLEEIVRRISELPADSTTEEAEALDSEFHRHLIEGSGSAMLRRVWATVDPYTWMIMHVWQEREEDYLPGHAELYEDHRRLLDALRSGDAGEAEEVIHHHIARRWERKTRSADVDVGNAARMTALQTED